MICKLNFPRSCVEKSGLQKFIRTVSSLHKLPSRKGSYTAQYITKTWNDICDEFAIDRSKIISITTDGGANMVAIVRLFLGKDHRIPCLAHCLNLLLMGPITSGATSFRKKRRRSFDIDPSRIVAKILATKSQTNKNTPDMVAISQLKASSVASGRLASAVNLAVPDNRSSLTEEHIKERVLLMSIPDDYWFE
ncbi:hypothetical protein KQX54_014744 [Cotesia glomerata]|uniref:Uncharacterized protein n=1 Tax=Cotesia glomerata TaxID=32391 RepID=A0AAV7J4L2_COTGL|nr:hypothetical protein KQX54_014744 [Cotesia glomerata]